MRIIKRKELIWVVLIFGLFGVSTARATFEWEVPLPPAPGGVTLDATSIDTLFNYLYNFGLGLGGFFAFIRLILAGIKWGAEGAGIPQRAAAINDIKNTLFGLLLLLFSWVILNTVNPQILNLNLKVSQATPQQTETRQGLAGVFDSLTNSPQRRSLEEVLRQISQEYLIQVKHSEVRPLVLPQLNYLSVSTSTTTLAQCPAGEYRPVTQFGIACQESSGGIFNCETPLSCELINDLIELKHYLEPVVLAGSNYGSHQEQRAVDLLLFEADPNIIDPRDQLMMEFFQTKKGHCGDELFAPAKFGDLCYFISNNQATSTCDFYADQIHYSVLKNCQL